MKSAKEIWLPIKEYEKYYAISNLGNVKSLRGIKNITKEMIKYDLVEKVEE